MKIILEKDLHILNTNRELKKVFENKALFDVRKNKNLRQLIGGNIIEKKAANNQQIYQRKMFTVCFKFKDTLF